MCWRPGAGGRGRELLLPFLPSSYQPLQIASFVISAKTHKDKLYFLIFCFLCGKQHQLLCFRFSLKYLDVILIAHGVHIKDPPKPRSVTVVGCHTDPYCIFLFKPTFSPRSPSASQSLWPILICAPLCEYGNYDQLNIYCFLFSK